MQKRKKKKEENLIISQTVDSYYKPADIEDYFNVCVPSSSRSD